MLAFAALGITVNGYAAWRASRGNTLNEKVVSWHLLEDVAGWAAVLVAAVVLLLTNWSWIDPVLAVAITLFILFNVLRRLREVASTFLQAAPAELNLADLRRELEGIDGIASIHHLHAWSLDGERHVISCHAILPPGADVTQYQVAKRKIRGILGATHTGHLTVELEFDSEDCSARELD
jgi:cobalt-zinc-cadmium efflux system protein